MNEIVKAAPAIVISTGHTFLEGPRWHDGALWVSDFYSERVLRFQQQSDGTHTQRLVCTVPGRPSGLGFTPSGDLLVVSMLERSVQRWDGATLSTFAEFSHLIDGVANDMLVLESGWSFVGNFGNSDSHPDSLVPTGLVRISPDGRADLVAKDLVFPNGIVVVGGDLVVAETFAGRLTAFELDQNADGGPAIGESRTWKQFGTAPDYLDIARATTELTELPDGLAADASGAIWVASANGHQAMRFAADGELLEYVDVGELSVYSLALGGPNLTTLYLCCAPPLGETDPSKHTDSVLMAAEVRTPGA